MRKQLLIIPILVLLFGCASQSRVVYNTLAGVEITTTGAYDAYLDLVIKGAVPTNSVPAISRKYNIFKIEWAAAVAIAQWNTNAPATTLVSETATKVLVEISNAKAVQ
jgi:hypothetical protein